MDDWIHQGSDVKIPAGTRIFQPGDPCTQFVQLKRGSVRVDLLTLSGKALMLYRFGAGESCIMTTSCLLSERTYTAEAWAEEDVEAIVLSRAQFQESLDSSSTFRAMVLGSFSDRLAAMMQKIEELTFVPMDCRLARALLQRCSPSGEVTATHQDLANDLGSAREVVSRKLSLWERNGLIERYRGGLVITDAGAIERLAAHQ